MTCAVLSKFRFGAQGPVQLRPTWPLQASKKIVSLFHLHRDEYKCSVLVQQPVVQGQETGPAVRVSLSLPGAKGERQAIPGAIA